MNGTCHTIIWGTPWAIDWARTLITPNYDVISQSDGNPWDVLATSILDPEVARSPLLEYFGADASGLVTLDQGNNVSTSCWRDQLLKSGVSKHAFTITSLADSGTAVTMVTYLGPIPSFGAGELNAV